MAPKFRRFRGVPPISPRLTRLPTHHFPWPISANLRSRCAIPQGVIVFLHQTNHLCHLEKGFCRSLEPNSPSAVPPSCSRVSHHPPPEFFPTHSLPSLQPFSLLPTIPLFHLSVSRNNFFLAHLYCCLSFFSCIIFGDPNTTPIRLGTPTTI